MILAESKTHPVLADLISTDDAENEAIEFEPVRLNLEARPIDF